MKNIILFGAGASFGSDTSDVPPLTPLLFEKLANFNPHGWGALPNEYRTSFKEDFEQGMIKVANERPHDLPILQRAMAAFFFDFQPKNTNLYYRFAQELKKSPKKVSLATLNYERLLEISFNAAGHNLMIGIPNPNEIELILPHGCCHLFCESVRGMAGAVSFAGMNVQVNGEIKIISNPQDFNQRINNDAFPPVMSYFEPSKRATAGQNFLEEQRARYNELIQKAETITVIGVKIREHDTHIWDPIKNSNAKFVYCSGSIELDDYNEWTLRNRGAKDNVFIDGFWSNNFNEVINELEN
ncbi:hypothetical protein V8G69_01590 [Gaetbulibacter sp. M235]|uniref:hypothetical protein n=1 Tax=Gaetbulibacter sp. M235 TaxID=3126510 RepID=UPI00374E44A5